MKQYRSFHEFYELIKGYPYNPEILKGDAVVYQGVVSFLHALNVQHWHGKQQNKV
jgi:hypothetical protein